jgi:hypothetical protein
MIGGANTGRRLVIWSKSLMRSEGIVLDFDETRVEGVLTGFLHFNRAVYNLPSGNTSDYELLDFAGRVVPQETNIMALNEGDRLELVYKPKDKSRSE